MWNSYHRDGYYYLEGGSQAISDALEAVIKEKGGEILLSTRVTGILVEDGAATGVQTGDGRTYRSRYVISNANAPDTLFKLVGREHLPAGYVAAVELMEVGASALVVYLGVDHDYSSSFSGTHEWFINVAGDSGQEVDFGLVRSAEVDMEKIPFAVANYTVVDPATAPAGKNVICLTTIMPYDWKQGWYEECGYEKYTRLKNEVGMQLVKRAEKFLPGLSEHIEVMEVGSPRTMEHYTSNPGGAIVGWANTPEQSMFKRLPQETPIGNLFLAGAWTFPCGRQSAVIMSGIFAAEKVLAGLD
jgi:prolycopene isomerase